MKPEEVVEAIKNHVAEARVVNERRVQAVTDLGKYREALRSLREKDIRHLSAISGVDLGKEVAIIFHVDCAPTLLNLRLTVPKTDPKLRTVTDIFPGAVLYEREVMEMLGVVFEGHPDPRPLFLPDDWREGHPLRKEWSG